jgi:hypothetical protein
VNRVTPGWLRGRTTSRSDREKSLICGFGCHDPLLRPRWPGYRPAEAFHPAPGSRGVGSPWEEDLDPDSHGSGPVRGIDRTRPSGRRGHGVVHPGWRTRATRMRASARGQGPPPGAKDPCGPGKCLVQRCRGTRTGRTDQSIRKLVDEVRLWVHPVVWGRGEQIIHDGEPVPLKLVDSKSFHSGVTVIRFQPANHGRQGSGNRPRLLRVSTGRVDR